MSNSYIYRLVCYLVVRGILSIRASDLMAQRLVHWHSFASSRSLLVCIHRRSSFRHNQFMSNMDLVDTLSVCVC